MRGVSRQIGSPLRALRAPLACLVLLLAAALLPHAALAAPVSYHPVPGTPDQEISNLTPTAKGGLWATQELAWGPFNEQRRMRLLHFDSAGNLLLATPEQEGDPVFTALEPAADGGVWVLAFRSLRHISPAGEVKEVSIPLPFFPDQLVAGGDGRAWVRACRSSLDGGFHDEECQVIAASDSGATESFPAPELEIDWPPGVTSSTSASWAVPTATGVWFVRAYAFAGATAWSTKTAFVSRFGEVSPVPLPAGAFPVERAAGDAAWWIRERGLAGATIGQIGVDGQVYDTQDLGNVSDFEPPDPYSTGAGRNGNLLWAQNAGWSDTVDGQGGVSRPDGSDSSFLVPRNWTAVLIDPEANWWSGSCTFGSTLYEAVDGSIWTLSLGHPSRITRQQPSGEFSVFLLGDGADRGTDDIFSLSGLVETGPRSLWFTRNTPNGPQLARLDPLDPPPAEVRYPGSPRTSGEGGRTLRQRILRLLGSMLGQSRVGVRRQQRLWADQGRPRPLALQERGRFSVRGRFPVAGRATIRLESRGPRKRTALVAFGVRKGAAGEQTIVVRFKPRPWRLLMRNPESADRLVLSAAFDAGKGKPLTRSMRLGLR